MKRRNKKLPKRKIRLYDIERIKLLSDNCDINQFIIDNFKTLQTVPLNWIKSTLKVHRRKGINLGWIDSIYEKYRSFRKEEQAQLKEMCMNKMGLEYTHIRFSDWCDLQIMELQMDIEE